MCGLTTKNQLFNDQYSSGCDSSRLGCVGFMADPESIENRIVDESRVVVIGRGQYCTAVHRATES